MTLNKLPRTALKLNCIYAAIASLAIFFLYALVLIFSGELRGALAISLGVISVLLVALIWTVSVLSYKRYRYGYDERRIVVHKGVIFRRRVVIPICQIQDLHRVQGPIMLLLNLGGVEISTAGSNFTLANLSTHSADEMIDALVDRLENIIEVQNDEKVL